MSATIETLSAARQKIEVEKKCVKQRKQRENASVWQNNASILDMNDDKDERDKIIYEDRDNRSVADMDHHVQHFKAKAYYQA